MPPLSPALVIIPTYNERENIAAAVERVLDAVPDIHVLIVDDGSPDGTGEIADRLARDDARVHVMHRTGKRGLGPAYIDAFRRGADEGYDVLIEMDADGSHPAESLPTMLAVLDGDVGRRIGGVVGSRWVPGGSVVDWPWTRQFISRGGSTYARAMLGLKLRDVTSGYRVYRAEAVQRIDLDQVDSTGYCFQIDMSRRILGAGYGLVEVPITFRDREFGDSKMNSSIVVEAMAKVTAWGMQRVLGRRPTQSVDSRPPLNHG